MTVEDGSLAVIDSTEHVLMELIPVGVGHGIAVASDEASAYVALYQQGKFAVIDTQILQVANVISAGLSPSDIALSAH